LHRLDGAGALARFLDGQDTVWGKVVGGKVVEGLENIHRIKRGEQATSRGRRFGM
jgi:cyclophilin family peptidyl-prolyl cis-trans isomerase